MRTRRMKVVHRTRQPEPAWPWVVAALLLGLIVGWLAIGWGAWPVSYQNAAASSLRPAEREEYLRMVAESFDATGDLAMARMNLRSWSQDRLAEDLARLEARLWMEDGVGASQVRALAAALGIERSGTPGPASTAVDLTKTENILVLGTDNRPQLEAWRTDTIMVVAIDRKSNKVGIVSIPRDLYVDMPGAGRERINAAHYVGEKTDYPGGGPALARRVVEEALGIPTQHYAIMRQEGLVELVDALGGVTVTLDCPLYEAAPDSRSPDGLQTFVLPAGQVYLDGPSAKKFVTYRYFSNDFGRVRRQQQLIWAIRNRALQGDVLPRIPELWQALSDTFTTDLSVADVVRLATFGVRLQPENIHAMVLGDDVVESYTTPEGWEVLVVKDQAALQEKLSTLFSSPPLSRVGRQDPANCPPSPFGDAESGAAEVLAQ